MSKIKNMIQDINNGDLKSRFSSLAENLEDFKDEITKDNALSSLKVEELETFAETLEEMSNNGTSFELSKSSLERITNHLEENGISSPSITPKVEQKQQQKRSNTISGNKPKFSPPKPNSEEN